MPGRVLPFSAVFRTGHMSIHPDSCHVCSQLTGGSVGRLGYALSFEMRRRHRFLLNMGIDSKSPYSDDEGAVTAYIAAELKKTMSKRLQAPEAKSGQEDLMRIEAQLVALERATRQDEEHREFELRAAAQAHQASPMTDGVFANYALSAPSALAHRCSPLAESQ